MHILRIVGFILFLVLVTQAKRHNTEYTRFRNDTCDKEPGSVHPVLIDLNLDNPMAIHNISKDISAEHVPGFHLSLKLNIHVGGRTPQEQKEHAHTQQVISKLGQGGCNQILDSLVKLLMPIHGKIQDLLKDLKNYLKLLTAAGGNVIVKISALLRDFNALIDNMNKKHRKQHANDCE